MNRNDMRWNESLKLLLEYIHQFHKFPLYYEEYKGVKLDRWLRHQIDAYRGGFLPKEREILLDIEIPEWKESMKRQELNEKYLLKDDWRQQIKGIPIDTFLKGKELIKALSNGIYDCDTWLEINHDFQSFTGGLKVFTCYQKIYPHLHTNYIYLLATVFLSEDEIRNISSVKEFLNILPFKNPLEMYHQIEDILEPFPVCFACINMRYGISTGNIMTIKAIADNLGYTKSKVQNAIKKAKKKIKKSDILKISEKDDSIKALRLSTRANNCLLRSHINTISQLEKTSFEELINIKNMGTKTANEIQEKLENHKRIAP